MSNAIWSKHRENLQKVLETHDGKKAILQTWEEWRSGRVQYKGKRMFDSDPLYEQDLTRRVRNLFVRMENMKPIGDLDD